MLGRRGLSAKGMFDLLEGDGEGEGRVSVSFFPRSFFPSFSTLLFFGWVGLDRMGRDILFLPVPSILLPSFHPLPVLPFPSLCLLFFF